MRHASRIVSRIAGRCAPHPQSWDKTKTKHVTLKVNSANLYGSGSVDFQSRTQGACTSK